MNNINNNPDHILRVMYHEIMKNNGLIQFTKDVRQEGKALLKPHIQIKTDVLTTLFGNKEVWEKVKTGNGHHHYQNILVPKIHIGFEAHGDNVVYGKHLAGVLEQVQETINIFCNEIFHTPRRGQEPNFNDAINEYRRYLTTGEQN